MKRRIIILAVSTVLSLAIMLATMQLVVTLINRIFGYPVHAPKNNVIWIIPK